MHTTLRAYTVSILRGERSFGKRYSYAATQQEIDATLPAYPPPTSCHSSQPEYQLARLRSRIQEVRELIHEDLHDLDEPLSMLLDEEGTISEQHSTLRHAALQARAEIESDIDQALSQLDALFSGELWDLSSARADVMTPY